MGYCRITARALHSYCTGNAGVLHGHCRVTARALRGAIGQTSRAVRVILVLRECGCAGRAARGRRVPASPASAKPGAGQRSCAVPVSPESGEGRSGRQPQREAPDDVGRLGLAAPPQRVDLDLHSRLARARASGARTRVRVWRWRPHRRLLDFARRLQRPLHEQPRTAAPSAALCAVLQSHACLLRAVCRAGASGAHVAHAPQAVLCVERDQPLERRPEKPGAGRARACVQPAQPHPDNRPACAIGRFRRIV